MSTSLASMDWKNPINLEKWRADRRKRLEDIWNSPGEGYRDFLIRKSFATQIDEKRRKLYGSDEAAEAAAKIIAGIRVENTPSAPLSHGSSFWRVPKLLEAKNPNHPDYAPARWRLVMQNADKKFLEKAMELQKQGLDSKANRQVACEFLAAEVQCQTGHHFQVLYECGNRFCSSCGPRRTAQAFAATIGPLKQATAKILNCGDPNCKPCYWWAKCKGIGENGESLPLPHWPPARGQKPKKVVAIFDFTLRNAYLADPWILRSGFKQMNGWIKKFFRTLERRYGISRKEYGFLFCDELGGNNTNMHAHGIYVGPWLPQKQREMSQLWDEVTGGMGQIVFLKYVDSIERGLYHAMKYPAKFAILAKPDRLAFLEVVFHKVRRIHAFASFYNMARDDEDSIQIGKCAICGESVSMPLFRFVRSDLDAIGLPNLISVHREIGKGRAMGRAAP